MKHDLVDAFWLMIIPVTLGGEKRLFAEGTIPAAFKVTESTVTSKGVIIVHYERAGAVPTAAAKVEWRSSRSGPLENVNEQQEHFVQRSNYPTQVEAVARRPSRASRGTYAKIGLEWPPGRIIPE